jgi:hypothetical protein
MSGSDRFWSALERIAGWLRGKIGGIIHFAAIIPP